MIESCSLRTIGHAYGVDFPEFHILTFFFKLDGLIRNFKTASLLIPSSNP